MGDISSTYLNATSNLAFFFVGRNPGKSDLAAGIKSGFERLTSAEVFGSGDHMKELRDILDEKATFSKKTPKPTVRQVAQELMAELQKTNWKVNGATDNSRRDRIVGFIDDISQLSRSDALLEIGFRANSGGLAVAHDHATRASMIAVASQSADGLLLFQRENPSIKDDLQRDVANLRRFRADVARHLEMYEYKEVPEPVQALDDQIASLDRNIQALSIGKMAQTRAQLIEAEFAPRALGQLTANDTMFMFPNDNLYGRDVASQLSGIGNGSSTSASFVVGNGFLLSTLPEMTTPTVFSLDLNPALHHFMTFATDAFRQCAAGGFDGAENRFLALLRSDNNPIVAAAASPDHKTQIIAQLVTEYAAEKSEMGARHFFKSDFRMRECLNAIDHTKVVRAQINLFDDTQMSKLGKLMEGFNVVFGNMSNAGRWQGGQNLTTTLPRLPLSPDCRIAYTLHEAEQHMGAQALATPQQYLARGIRTE